VDLVSSLPAFLLAVLLIAASPGPAIALILRRAALRGFRGAVPTVLGLELGLRERHTTADAEDLPGAAAAGGRGWWVALGEGLLVQPANPKAAVFVIAFYPQFVPADRPLFATTAVLALVQVALETLLYLCLAAGVARAGAWFRRPRVRSALETVSGTVLVGLGVRVAVSSR
jgi:threonine/homoserine/homoserine lactone efflux protein